MKKHSKVYEKSPVLPSSELRVEVDAKPPTVSQLIDFLRTLPPESPFYVEVVGVTARVKEQCVGIFRIGEGKPFYGAIFRLGRHLSFPWK